MTGKSAIAVLAVLLAAAGGAYWFLSYGGMDATSANLSAPAAPKQTKTNPEEINPVTFPPEFAKLVESGKTNADKTQEKEEDLSLKLGADLPALEGDWITADGKAPDLNNKVFLLDLWTTSCTACVAGIPANNKLQHEYAAKGLVVAGATPEAKALIEEFKIKVAIDYSVLTHCNALFKQLDIHEIPAAFLFGKNGKLAWKGDIVDIGGKLTPDFEKALSDALK
jgi:thiol-disulfide isomerase/thioredoxin